MPRVSTFCPRCGEAIETEVPEEARLHGRAELACPACRFEFVIAPARSGGGTRAAAPTPPEPGTGVRWEGTAPRAVSTERAGGTERRGISFKPLAAGLMLFFVAVLGLWMGSVLVFSDDLVEAGFANMQGEGAFTGRVVDDQGRGIEGVHVEWVSAAGEDEATQTAHNTTTGPDGRYSFEGIPPGVHEFRFTMEGRQTVVLEAPAYPRDYSPLFGDASALGQVTMPAGDPGETKEVSRLEEFQRLATGWGWFTIVASIMALAGGWACLRRKGFPLALIGAIAGILTFGFIVGSAVAAIAFILILMSRREFAPLRRNDPGQV